MIRVVGALAWMRWRRFRNALRPVRRDTLERVSRIVHVIAPVLLAAAAIPAALGLGVGAGALGYLLARGGPQETELLIPLRIALAIIFLPVLITPVLRSVQGMDDALSRLLLLPVGRGVLYLHVMASGFVDPWILLVLPALALFPVGLAAGGAWTAAAVAAGCAVLFLVVLGGVAGVGSMVLQVLFRDRRRGELVSLAIALALCAAGLVPSLAAGLIPRDGARQRLPSGAVAVSRALPSEMLASAVRGAVADRPRTVASSAGGLVVWAVLVHVSGAALYRRLVEEPDRVSRRRGAAALRLPRLRLPGATPAAQAVAAAQLRTALRTVRGRIAIAVSPLIVLFLGAQARILADDPEITLLLNGAFAGGLGAMTAILGLQPIVMNQFASDGPGLALQLLAPMRERDLVVGKMIAGWILSVATALVAVLAAVVLYPREHPLTWPILVTTALGTALLLGPVGALLSAVFPKSVDLSRMGKQGNPHHLAALVGTGLTMACAAPPAALAAGAILVARSHALALALVAGWAILSAVAAMASLGLVSRAVEQRRENLWILAQGR